MIPYLPPPALQVGPLVLSPFGFLMVCAIVLGRFRAIRRAERNGVDPADVDALCVAMLTAGLAGALIAKLGTSGLIGLLYRPFEVLSKQGGIASMGGLGGGLIGAILFARNRGWSRMDIMRRLDMIAFTLPSAWILGRLGCALAHDHRGYFTHSWIAVQFPEGARFDLGLMEFLLLIPLAALFEWLDRRPRPIGFFFAVYGVTYGMLRLFLDRYHDKPLLYVAPAITVLVGIAGWFCSRESVRANSCQEKVRSI